MVANNQLVQSKNTAPSVGATIATFLSGDAVKKNIVDVVGKMNSTRFVTSIVSAVQNTPALKECTNVSIFSAALLGQGLELSPSPQLGQFYMVPFEDKKSGIKQATFVLGYKGYIQLAIRSGQYKRLNVMAIKEGELIYFDPLNEEINVQLMVDDWDAREQAKTIGYYAFFELTNGFRKAMYWSIDQMINHADKYSPAFSKNATAGRYPKVSYADYCAGKYDKKDSWLYSSFWYKDFDGMAYKTMLRQLISKWGPMSIDMQTAFAADNAVVMDGVPVAYAESEAPSAQEEEPETVAVKEPDRTDQATPPVQSQEDIDAVLFS